MSAISWVFPQPAGAVTEHLAEAKRSNSSGMSQPVQPENGQAKTSISIGEIGKDYGTGYVLKLGNGLEPTVLPMS
ncbi:hypothetical protein GCM10011396_46150 [Undibacterium terreum]|uniref:Uncharacterized protein n=1 Tax=Undibacterium terreum TaxID=1224302 RepID=A0A916UXT4_9BURK|nr:hypothetical protein GCM10011396_46150 [Undibacterium terreum]